MLQGYKHYHHRHLEPEFYFGAGLSYTTFRYSNLKLSAPSFATNDVSLTASLTVTNTGSVTGSDVVQLYITFPTASKLTHPPLMLKAFAKVRDLAPGKSEAVTLHLDKYAVSYWDDLINSWVVEPGEYLVRVGRSSAPSELTMSAELVLQKGFEWRGL